MAGSAEILVYITSNASKIHGGDPLTLIIKDEQERRDIIRDISLALRAEVAELKNGDYIIISRS